MCGRLRGRFGGRCARLQGLSSCNFPLWCLLLRTLDLYVAVDGSVIRTKSAHEFPEEASLVECQGRVLAAANPDRGRLQMRSLVLEHVKGLRVLLVLASLKK